MNPEEKARVYAAAMDSVNLINKLVAEAPLNKEDKDTVRRNVEHLEIIVAKPYWTEDDNLLPFKDAIIAGESVL